MKKILFLALVVFGAHQFFASGGFSGSHEAFDENGNPMARLFVGPGCGRSCEDLEREIRNRNVKLVVIDVTSKEGEGFGVRSYPLTVVGDRQVIGSSKLAVVGVLAETYGESVLTLSEKRAMQNHFDQRGQPRVVLYGTKWCGFCKRQRELFADKGVEFMDIDVEETAEGRRSYNTLQGVGYPLVYVGYRRFEGYREKDLLAAIDELVP